MTQLLSKEECRPEQFQSLLYFWHRSHGPSKYRGVLLDRSPVSIFPSLDPLVARASQEAQYRPGGLVAPFLNLSFLLPPPLPGRTPSA